MKRLLPLLFGVAASVVMVQASVEVAEAGRCTQACERLRRGCLFENKFIFDGAKVACLADAAVCRDDCEASLTGRELKVCKRGCRSVSLDCRRSARATLRANQGQCNVDDDICIADCEVIEDIGRDCVRSCARAVTPCFKAVKEAKEDCFHTCHVSPSPGCKRDCRAGAIEGHTACGVTFWACLDTCAP